VTNNITSFQYGVTNAVFPRFINVHPNRKQVRLVAGVCNAGRNVFGLMPHPEHAVDPLLGSGDGALILAALVDAARERTLATA